MGVRIHQSVLKRERQSIKRHLSNKAVINKVKTLVKKLQTAITSKKLSEARQFLPLIISTIDKAAAKGIIHRNTAARKVSRLTRSIRRAESGASPSR